MWPCGSWFPVPHVIFRQLVPDHVHLYWRDEFCVADSRPVVCQHVNRCAWMFIQNRHIVFIFVVSCYRVIGWQDRFVVWGSMCHLIEVRLRSVLILRYVLCVHAESTVNIVWPEFLVFSLDILHLCSKLAKIRTLSWSWNTLTLAWSSVYSVWVSVLEIRVLALFLKSAVMIQVWCAAVQLVLWHTFILTVRAHYIMLNCGHLKGSMQEPDNFHFYYFEKNAVRSF